MRRLVGAIAVALTPAVFVVLSVELLRLIEPAPVGLAWTPVIHTAMAATAGFIAGLVLIHRQLLLSIGRLGHADHVAEARA